MEWNGDEAKLLQLCQLFGLASSPDNNIQQQVMASLNQCSQLPDFNMYLVTIFAKMQGQEEVVRQRAGLLLKTNLSREANVAGLPPQMLEYLQVQTLAAVRDPNKVIRHTAGSVITTFVQKVGVTSCGKTLDALAGLLGDANPDIVEGSFSALNKICEDGVMVLSNYWDAPPADAQPFVSWCTDRLLPSVLQYASPQAHVHARRNAIECLNHFALNYMFEDQKYPTFLPYAQKYVEVLGVLANDEDVTVLKDVCKGFVCVIDNGWACVNKQLLQVVLQYMLKASRHPEYAVRLEALEVWTPCTRSSEMLELVKPMLPELVPVLLANMVYSQADYMGMEQAQIEDDNAALPDLAEDIKPRFHKEQGDEDDEEGGRGGAWGAEWTARKAAASALDHLANALRQEILQVVLPLIQQKLEDQNWEVQESGVLALGAIAWACMESLVPFLPAVMELLLKLTHAPKPLLRSISCWTAARFSGWICHEQTANREQVLRAVLQALLQRVLDRNKRVQEAACSAFATLEEEAKWQLVPYLDDIIKTLVQAFQYYQAKNLLILYDAVGTLAQCVGSELDKPQHVQALMGPIVQKFDTVPDNDRSTVALFECLGWLAKSLGPSFLPMVPRVVERCTRLILSGARAAQMYLQNPNEFEKPDREVVAASLDLLAGIVEGMRERTSEVLQQQNFIMVLPEVLKDSALNVKQSAFALVGDCAQYCIEFLVPHLPEILSQCAASLNANTSVTVSNNASWAIGEICIRVGPEAMAPYLEPICAALVGVLTRPGPRPPHLMQNMCFTLGRLGRVCGPRMGEAFAGFARPWCMVMRGVRNDGEKVNAFTGLANMVKANPQAALTCVPELAGAISSFYPAPPALEPSFREILTGYKATLGEHWPTVYAQFQEDVKARLAQMYSLGP